MIISHNLMAMNANRVLGTNTKNKAKTTEKLSSGYKINRAADDAAGLAISEKMRKQIRGLTQASANCQDGVSYVQVADGALDEVQDMLHRMTELSVKAANGTNSASDRQAINSEINEIKSEMSRIFETTSFNEQKIWGIESDIANVDRKQVGTDEIIGLKRNKIKNSVTLNNTNAWAVPESSVMVSADDSGLRFSWTGYNGKNYSTNSIAWGSDISGKHTISIKDYLDTTTNPELKGIDFTYSYEVDDKVKKSELIDFLNGDSIGVSAKGMIDERFNSTSGEQLFGIRNSNGTHASLKVLLEGGANLEVNDYDFLKAINNGKNISKNPLQTGNDNDICEFTFNNPKLGDITISSNVGYYNPMSLSITEKGSVVYSSYYDSADFNDIKNIMEEFKNNKNVSSGGELYFPTYDAKTSIKNSSGYAYDLFGFGIKMAIPLSSSSTIDDVMDKYSELGGLTLWVEANSTAALFYNDKEKNKI